MILNLIMEAMRFFLVGIVSFWVLALVVHFPEYDAGYFKQLAAEQLVAKVVKGSPKREW